VGLWEASQVVAPIPKNMRDPIYTMTLSKKKEKKSTRCMSRVIKRKNREENLHGTVSIWTMVGEVTACQIHTPWRIDQLVHKISAG
jgi:hypothetical protein